MVPCLTAVPIFSTTSVYFLVLLAFVYAHYNFIYVNVESFGKCLDGGIFALSSLYKSIQNRTLEIPANRALLNTVINPSIIIADSTLSLKTYLTRPYRFNSGNHDQDIYNYRLGLARRVVENGFEILALEFIIYTGRTQMKPDEVDQVILATCVLYNLIRKFEKA